MCSKLKGEKEINNQATAKRESSDADWSTRMQAATLPAECARPG